MKSNSSPVLLAISCCEIPFDSATLRRIKTSNFQCCSFDCVSLFFIWVCYFKNFIINKVSWKHWKNSTFRPVVEVMRHIFVIIKINAVVCEFFQCYILNSTPSGSSLETLFKNLCELLTIDCSTKVFIFLMPYSCEK